MRLAALAAALALGITGCRQTRAYEPPDAGPLLPVLPSAGRLSPVEPEVSPVLGRALLDKDGRTALCLDFNARDQLPADAGPWTAARRRHLVDAMNAFDGGSSPGPGMSEVVIPQSCESAFADRLVLASCAFVGSQVFYYSFDLPLDVEMRDCIKSQGTWEALPRDSQQYRRAHARWQLERAQQQLRQLQR